MYCHIKNLQTSPPKPPVLVRISASHRHIVLRVRTQTNTHASKHTIWFVWDAKWIIAHCFCLSFFPIASRQNQAEWKFMTKGKNKLFVLWIIAYAPRCAHLKKKYSLAALLMIAFFFIHATFASRPVHWLLDVTPVCYTEQHRKSIFQVYTRLRHTKSKSNTPTFRVPDQFKTQYLSLRWV